MTNSVEAPTNFETPLSTPARIIYRAIRFPVYITLYSYITIASLVTKKDELTVLNEVSVKLGLGPVDPD